MKHTISPLALSYGVFRMLPAPMQRTIIAIHSHMRDPKPEGIHTLASETALSGTFVWGRLPMLTFTNALGTLSVAYAYSSSRYVMNVTASMQIFFWSGLLLIFVPSMVRFISPTASRFERLSLLCVVGICFYLIKVMYGPLSFFDYDEFQHWRTAEDIARSGHLFAENALLPVSPDYPGLEIVTNEFSMLSGLNIFYAGITVVGTARIVMIVSLFLFNEQFMKSTRMAGISTMIYMCNTHFLVFDAQFGYESLALPLATFTLFALTYHDTLNRNHWGLTLIAWITLAAVVATHHLTDFIFVGLLVLWVLMYLFLRRTTTHQSPLIQTTLFGVVLSVAYVALVAQPVVVYISSFLSGAFTELGRVLIGSSSSRQLFVDYGGDPTPVWERVVSLSATGLVIVSLPFGLSCLWLHYRSNVLAWTLGIVSLSYPFTLLFHFTTSGIEISDRTTAFLFIPLSCIVTLCVTQFWPTRSLRWRQTTLITGVLTVIFLGGVILGAGPSWYLLPGGPHYDSADSHSIEPEGIQAAIWTRSYLGPNNRVATDRINQLLMSVYGEQRNITGVEDSVEVAPIFFSPSLGPSEVAILRHAKIRYLVVDMRLATALPRLGFYFDSGEYGAYHYIAPIDQADLTKFATIPNIKRVFDSGDIVIYDVGGFTNAY